MSNKLFSQPYNLFVLIAAFFLILPNTSKATVVTMETSLGDISIELFDADTPATVSNFLNYVNDGDYVDSFIHRSVPGFIVQGGGYQFDGTNLLDIPTDSPVINEYQHSNLRGTIAMAKLGDAPDSATSQWFFNLADNSANLDNQNGGFTVFGQVIGDGMSIVDAIADLPTFNISPFPNIPLDGYTDTFDPNSQLIKINNVTVVATPIPAALYLFASGLLGVIGFSRKQHKKN